MDAREIARRRLANQRLTSRPFGTPEDVVAHLGAMQAQEYAYAKWSIGQRTAGLVDADVDSMLADGRLIRTHLLRPTWHFVLPADVRWLMTITAPRVHASNRHWLRQLELDEATLARSQDVVTGALEGRRLTRMELQRALAQAGIDAAGPRLAYILMQAELGLLICSGGLRGKQHTYALLDDVVPRVGAATLATDDALGEVARRYFTGHGPATIHDLTWWSSLTITEARRGLAVAADHLQRTIVDGVEYWSGTDEPPAGRAGSAVPDVHLLQGYDEAVIGYQKTRGVLDVSGQAAAAINRSFFHPIVIDTQIAGFWRRATSASELVVELRWLRSISGRESRALALEAARLGAFEGLPVSVRESR